MFGERDKFWLKAQPRAYLVGHELRQKLWKSRTIPKSQKHTSTTRGGTPRSRAVACGGDRGCPTPTRKSSQNPIPTSMRWDLRQQQRRGYVHRYCTCRLSPLRTHTLPFPPFRVPDDLPHRIGNRTRKIHSDHPHLTMATTVWHCSDSASALTTSFPTAPVLPKTTAL